MHFKKRVQTILWKNLKYFNKIFLKIQKPKFFIRKIQVHEMKTDMAKKLIKVCDSVSRIIILFILSFSI